MKPLATKMIAVGRTFGPYLAIELILPGGSLRNSAAKALERQFAAFVPGNAA